MIDLHAHILPGVDDGARTWDESLDMCRMAYDDGIHTMVMTSHYQESGMQVNGDTVKILTQELRDRLDKANLDITVVPGNEILAHPALMETVKKKKALTYGDDSCFLLLELPVHGLAIEQIKNLVFSITLGGITPILAHPERNMMFQRKPGLLNQVVGMGVYSQITAQSLNGHHGEEAQALSLEWFRTGLAHFLSTDAHNMHNRKPVMSQAFKILENELPPGQMAQIRDEFPLAVLKGQTLDLPEVEIIEEPVFKKPSILNLFQKAKS